jgi:hypothetical protein
VTRRLAREPFGWRPTTLLVTVRRYRCTGCGHVWRQDTSRAAEPRAKLSRRGLRWAQEGIVIQHRGSALGFRNLTNYIARSLLEAGGFRLQYTPDCEEPLYGQLRMVSLSLARRAC